MPNLNDMLNSAQDGQAMEMLSREFGLTSEQTEAAVMALLPAISMGLKRSTATPEGLANLFRVMGQQPTLQTMDSDARTAFGEAGRTAGNDVLSALFGSPEVSRAVAGQAQKLSGIGSGILKKLLPVLAGMLISRLMKSAKAAPSPSAPPSSPDSDGANLGDILRQIFGSAEAESSAPAQKPPAPSAQAPLPIPQQPLPIPGDQPLNTPANNGGQTAPGGGLLEVILRELQKGIQEGRIKPVVIPFPSQTPSSGSTPQNTNGDILGQILREILGKMSATTPGATLAKQLALTGGAGATVFGEHFEPGRDDVQNQFKSVQNIFDRLLNSSPA